MKKALDVFYVILAVIGGLWLSVQVLLWGVLPWQPVQDFLQKEISKAAGRPVQIDHISARLTGLDLRGVAVASSAKQTQQGELIRAERVLLRWSLWQLLKGKILVYAVIINGLDVHVIRYADGTFNFDGLFGAGNKTAEPATAEDSQSFSLDLNVRQLRLRDGHILFTDDQMNQSAEIDGLFFSARNFGFDGAFPVSVNASVTYNGRGWPEQKADLGLTVWPDLKNLDLSAASVKIRRLVLRHTGGVFVLEGGVKNFENPSVSLQLNGQDISDTLLRFAVPDVPSFEAAQTRVSVKASADLTARRAEIASLETQINSAVVYSSGPASAPVIALPEASVYLAASADWGKNRAQISSFTAQGLNSFVSSSGTVSWAPELDFNLSGAFKADLQAAGEAISPLKAYRPLGVVSGTAQGTPSAASADVTLEAVGAAVPYAGSLSDFTMRAVLTDLKDLQIPAFSGKLNGGDFDGSLSAAYNGKIIDADVAFHAARLALPAPETAASAQTAEREPAPVQDSTSGDVSSFVLPPVNLKAKADIDSLDAPYIWGNDIHFAADLQGLTLTLDQAHGELALETGKGEIKDLNKLTNANILTKVMFGSLSAVSKVINSLNVFAVLNGLGSGVVSAVSGKEDKPADMVVQTVKDENGNDVQIMVPYTDQKVDGRLAFELFSTDMTFTNGEAEIQKGSFVSDLMSFNLTGDMNFKTQTLDLKVNAAPGRHYEDGIMPLTLTVGGTLEEPKGSMSMTSSVTSLVTQGVRNNFVSRSVKKTLGGFFGLFKKKDKEEEAAPADTQDDVTAEEGTAAPPQSQEMNEAVQPLPETEKTAEAGQPAPAETTADVLPDTQTAAQK